MNNAFFGKKVLITGHTGFKGSWLSAWLKMSGAKVTGVGLDPYTSPSNFEASRIQDGIVDHRFNLCDAERLSNLIEELVPDYVFHLAAQALVRKSYEDPIETWQTNVMGTLHVLEGLRRLKNRCVAVIITSDKCYDNVEWIWGYRENDALGGPDPYSASKGAAELVIKSHIKSYFPRETSLVRIASARAGNVIGGGDWSLNRIVPDCIKAWSENKVVQLRSPHSTRPWQHVLEPLSGYLCLAVAMADKPELHGEAFNFGPQDQQNKSVLQLVTAMQTKWDQVKFVDVSGHVKGPYESGLLKLNCDKALHLLNWHAVLDFEETVALTTEWYKEYYLSSNNMLSYTMNQIKSYRAIALSKGMAWPQFF
ncbi:MAG: CDP-glucose 4,6-dehydratase [Hydrotalea sp.]|nr:CDP-glucose 4,6-dehydratase [Hydrotalea sp.]